MTRRSIVAFIVVMLAMLALAAPALAGGWAVVTLDSLPRDLRAGEAFQIGFMVRQHGKTPANLDLDGNPLKPVLTAIKQAAAGSARAGETIRAEARQQGPAGHYVVDLTLPSDGNWDWQIALPTFYVQDSPSGNNAAVFEPLSVQPAGAPAPAPVAQPVAAPSPQAATLLGVSPAALRWVGVALLLAALAIGLYAQRGAISRRPAQLQK